MEAELEGPHPQLAARNELSQLRKTPRSNSHMHAVGEAQNRNTAAVDRSREMRSTNGEALKEVESMTTYRYCITWEGMRLDFLGWMTIPKS